MKNQDPTANTDPNEYINQLVNVNSLEQLININQTLSSAVGSPGTTTPTGHVTGPVSRADAMSTGEGGRMTGSAIPGEKIGVHQANGNLSIPNATTGADRVAQALSGRHMAG